MKLYCDTQMGLRAGIPICHCYSCRNPECDLSGNPQELVHCSYYRDSDGVRKANGMPPGTCGNCGKTCRACSAEHCTNRAYCQNPAGMQPYCPEYHNGCNHIRLLNGHTICEDYDTHCRKKP
jgi:hypothetical protein